MPALQLPGDQWNWLVIQSVLLYPSPAEQSLRDRHILLGKIEHELNGKRGHDDVTLSAATVQALVDAPGHDQIRAEIAECTKRGTIAGDLLSVYFSMHHFELPEPSMKKAIWVVQEYARTALYGDETPIHCSDKKIREYYAEFKASAHLWAALRLNQSFSYAPPYQALDEENLPTFMGVAASIQRFATEYAPMRPKSKEVLFADVDYWRVPDEYPLYRLSTTTPPPHLLDVLARYKAG